MEIPVFKNEDEEREFWATHDSVDFLEGTEEVYLERCKDKTGTDSRMIYRSLDLQQV